MHRTARILAAAAMLLSLTACYGNDPRFLVPLAAGDAAAAAAPAAPALPFDNAVLAAADALFASARLPDAGSPGRHLLVDRA
jgi:hypothetical protein